MTARKSTHPNFRMTLQVPLILVEKAKSSLSSPTMTTRLTSFSRFLSRLIRTKTSEWVHHMGPWLAHAHSSDYRKHIKTPRTP